jgi:MoxR-like ATPase
VLPDDIKQLSRPALSHRLILSRDAEVEGITRSQVLDEILAKVEVL